MAAYLTWCLRKTPDPRRLLSVLALGRPDRKRPFRTPLVPLVPLLAIAGCLYLAVTLPADTWMRFAVWMGLGLVVYVLYARRASAVSAARRG